MLDVMRTTLTLDDDVLASARALAAQRGVPIGTVISDFARRGLASAQPAAIRNGIRLFPVRLTPVLSPPSWSRPWRRTWIELPSHRDRRMSLA